MDSKDLLLEYGAEDVPNPQTVVSLGLYVRTD